MTVGDPSPVHRRNRFRASPTANRPLISPFDGSPAGATDAPSVAAGDSTVAAGDSTVAAGTAPPHAPMATAAQMPIPPMTARVLGVMVSSSATGAQRRGRVSREV